MTAFGLEYRFWLRDLRWLVACCASAFVLGTAQPSSKLPHVFWSQRDPVSFAAGLEVVFPPPIKVATRSDAVAAELLRHTKSLSHRDVMRAAQRLSREAESLGFDPLLFVALIHVESYFDHLAVSQVGAEGLMQLMPATASWMAKRLELDRPHHHSFEPTLNIALGVHYFAFLFRRFERLDHALTAYNRGPAATGYILRRSGELPQEIYDFYAGKVLDRYASLMMRYGKPKSAQAAALAMARR